MNFLVRSASSFVRKCLLAEVALVTEINFIIAGRALIVLNSRLIIQVNSLVSNEIRSLNECFFTEIAFLTNTRVDEQMLFVGITANECFLAELASVDDALVN